MQNESVPLISIITPCFNSEKFLEQAIRSVLNQSYENWELILVNDRSTDGTGLIIENYKNKDPRIKSISLQENGGVANARNEGIESATGNYIAFLDSDDEWDKDKLGTQLSFMIANDYLLTHTAYRKINFIGEVIAAKIPVSVNVDYNKLLKHNEIGCLTAMFNVDKLGKKYFLRIGHEDYAFWLSILKNNIPSYGINKVLASYRIHDNTVSSNKLKAAGFTWKIYRETEKLSLFTSTVNFLFYAWNAMAKYLKKN